MKLVVCDDDVTLRSVVSRMAEGVGHTVIAETDRASDAVELVTRFGAEGLVLDLSLPWGTGAEAVHELRARAAPCEIVLFTSYADDSPELRDLVRAVVEKPDFELLEAVLQQLASADGAPTPVGRERRRTPRERPAIGPAVVRSPSGLEDPDSFQRVIDVLEPGDALLDVHVAAPEGPVLDPFNRLVHTDRVLAVARTLRVVLRLQDRMSGEGDELHAILLDGERAGVESVWRRLERAHEQAGIGGVLSGGWGVCQVDESPYAAQARARTACQRSIGQPPGDRLWAG